MTPSITACPPTRVVSSPLSRMGINWVWVKRRKYVRRDTKPLRLTFLLYQWAEGGNAGPSQPVASRQAEAPIRRDHFERAGNRGIDRRWATSQDLSLRTPGSEPPAGPKPETATARPDDLQIYDKAVFRPQRRLFVTTATVPLTANQNGVGQFRRGVDRGRLSTTAPPFEGRP